MKTIICTAKYGWRFGPARAGILAYLYLLYEISTHARRYNRRLKRPTTVRIIMAYVGVFGEARRED